MDPKLETFLTLCRTMNYRRAAERLNLTQPAVTKQIQALEALYGVKLFDYDGRRLRKTAQGGILEEYAIGQRAREEDMIRALQSRPKAIYRIGATKSIGDYILIPEIRRFLESPDNELFSRWTTRRIFWSSSIRARWISSCWRGCSTSSGMIIFYCGGNRISGCALRRIPLPGAR